MVSPKIFFRLIIQSIRGGNRNFHLQTFGFPLAVFVGVWLVFSLRAALIVFAIEVAVFIIAIIVGVVVTDFSQELKLEPWFFRSAVNKKTVERLAGELASFGFFHLGYFKVAGKELYLEGWVRRDWKIYAIIMCGNEHTDAYVEFSSSYSDGGSYCISGSKINEILPRPSNMIQINGYGKSTRELLGMFLKCRPERNLLDTPPENFVACIEEENKRMQQFMAKRN